MLQRCNVAMLRVYHCGIATLSSLGCHVTGHMVLISGCLLVLSEASVVVIGAVRFLTANTTFQVASIPYHGDDIDLSSATWSTDGVKAAIKKVQAGGSSYGVFANECMRAGVVGYNVFIEGKRVVYFGKDGDWHVEWFPGVGPGLGGK